MADTRRCTVVVAVHLFCGLTPFKGASWYSVKSSCLSQKSEYHTGHLPSYSWLLFLDSPSSIPVTTSSKWLRVTTIALEQASAICYRHVPGVSCQDSASRLYPSTWFSPWQPAETCYCLMGARLCPSLSENDSQAWSQFPELISIQSMHAIGSFTPAKQSSSQVVLVVKNPPANAGDLRDAGSIRGLGRSPGEGNDNRL